MLARRLFVAFTGYKFLHNLRSLGFQTFHGIIDETYDTIIDNNARYTAAFEQVKYLCSVDQQEIYAKIKPIVEHNYSLAAERDWTSWAADKINAKVQSIL